MASPPHIPQINAPRKRGSISSLSGVAKKRKPSALRNAYSPETESAGSPLRFSRSPSLESVATNSVINGAGGKKRRRKGDDTASVVSSARGGRGAKGGSLAGGEDGGAADGRDAEYEEDEDDDDMGEEMDMAVEGGMTAEERRKQEKDHERYVPSPCPTEKPYH
jgi:transcription initiation factor TFIID subunit 11